jgi:hypothetical protein
MRQTHHPDYMSQDGPDQQFADRAYDLMVDTLMAILGGAKRFDPSINPDPRALFAETARKDKKYRRIKARDPKRKQGREIPFAVIGDLQPEDVGDSTARSAEDEALQHIASETTPFAYLQGRRRQVAEAIATGYAIPEIAEAWHVQPSAIRDARMHARSDVLSHRAACLYHKLTDWDWRATAFGWLPDSAKARDGIPQVLEAVYNEPIDFNDHDDTWNSWLRHSLLSAVSGIMPGSHAKWGVVTGFNSPPNDTYLRQYSLHAFPEIGEHGSIEGVYFVPLTHPAPFSEPFSVSPGQLYLGVSALPFTEIWFDLHIRANRRASDTDEYGEILWLMRLTEGRSTGSLALDVLLSHFEELAYNKHAFTNIHSDDPYRSHHVCLVVQFDKAHARHIERIFGMRYNPGNSGYRNTDPSEIIQFRQRLVNRALARFAPVELPN